MSVLAPAGAVLPPIFGGWHPAYDVVIAPDGSVHVFFAGGPANAALAAGLLAPHVGLYQQVRLATLYGALNPPDTTEFREAGIRFDGLVVPGTLRENRLDLSRSCQAEPEHGLSDLKIGPGHIRTFRGFFASVRPGQVVAFTGSLPCDPQFPERYIVSPEEYADLVLWVLTEKRARIIIDARPGILRVILDYIKSMLGEDEAKKVFARVVAKQNRKEFQELALPAHLNGRPMAWADSAREILPGGSFIITGREHTLLVTPNTQQRLWIKPEDEPVVVATDGCGDSQVAGTAVGLALGQSIQAATRLGMGVAQANTENHRPGRHAPERALDLANRIIMEPVQ